MTAQKEKMLNDFKNSLLIKNNKSLQSIMAMTYQESIDFLNGWLSAVDMEEDASELNMAIFQFLRGIGECKY